MDKTVTLTDNVVNENGHHFASLRVVLNGDGSTPNVMAMGVGAPVGFDDNGKPIMAEKDDALLEERRQEMMAEAIKLQKELTKENGGDPSKVNIIGAETNTPAKPTARQTLTANMMRDIASLKLQLATLRKEGMKNE